MILHSLTLRGFKGLAAGVGLPEITIDFDKLPDGLIAVVGANGMGKTTLLDNCHPFRLMPYKLRKATGWSPAAFSFYDECCGSEAKKELIFSVGDTRYKSVLLIDADRRKQEATLYSLGDEPMYGGTARTGIHWLPLNDGKTRTYDEAVEKVCGSPSLFFTSVFRAQGARNLSDYTRGDIMAVVAELLNIDRIKEQGEKARKVAAALVLQVDTLQRDKSALAGDDLAVLQSSLDEATAAISFSASALKTYRHDLTTIEANRRELEVASAAEASTRQRISDKTTVLQKLREELACTHLLQQRVALENDFSAAKNAARPLSVRYSSDLGRLQERIKEIQHLLQREAEVKAAVAKLPGVKSALDDSRALLQSIRDDYASVREQVAALAGVPAEIATAERQLASLQLRTSALSGLDCRGDATSWVNDCCPLLRDAVAAKAEIAPTEAAIAAAKVRLAAKEDLDAQLLRLKSSGETQSAVVEQHEGDLNHCQLVANLLPQIEAAYSQEGDLQAEIVRVRSAHDVAAAEIDSRVADLTARLAKVNDDISFSRAEKALEIDAVTEEIRKLSASVGEGLAVELAGLDQKAATVREVITGAEAELSQRQAALGRIQSRLEAAEAAAVKVAEIDGKVAALNEEIANWNLLVKACGNDGVCALEVDDAGPSIAALTNDLLRNCYGPRFSIRLETQSAKLNGDAKEDFDITVFDAENGDQKSITALSGGQTTIIEDALTRAICLYNIGRSEKLFGTLYSDEKDGPLSQDKKVEFFAVKRRSLEIGSHSRELFITQTSDLLEMADGRIVLEKGRIYFS